MSTVLVPHVDTQEFNYVMNKLREFYTKKGFAESYVQNRLDILAACEDPTTMTTFDYCGYVFPLPQTGQMRLELELMNRTPDTLPGIYCVTTSYRAEPNPVPGRHDHTFPMCEFEARGNIDDLVALATEMLEHLGFKTPFPVFAYEDLCRKYMVTELTHEHERRLEEEYGPVVFIKDFPFRTDPFFNMKRHQEAGSPLYHKVDVIVGGMETFGTAERECDVELMRNNFYKISGGQYANTLFSRCGRERVLSELDDFLESKFVPRYGGGIGLTRLIKALKKYNLMPSFESSTEE